MQMKQIKKQKNTTKKKVFKNAKGLDAAAKENQKIKPTKNYTEKDVEKQYNEDIAKPQFITNKDKDENFVELDKNEDVSILLNNIYINLLIQLFAKNLASKKYEDVRDYNDNKEGEKKENIKEDIILKRIKKKDQ